MLHGRLHRPLQGLRPDGQGPVGGSFQSVAFRTAILKQPERLRPIGPLRGIDRGPDQSWGGGLFAVDPG